MSATTIKLDGEILEELHRIKPAGATLTSLVRELLESEIRRRRMVGAAAKYATFLQEHPDEAASLETWASAPLDRDPGTRSRPRRR
jgi:hypothetical protein